MPNEISLQTKVTTVCKSIIHYIGKNSLNYTSAVWIFPLNRSKTGTSKTIKPCNGHKIMCRPCCLDLGTCLSNILLQNLHAKSVSADFPTLVCWVYFALCSALSPKEGQKLLNEKASLTLIYSDYRCSFFLSDGPFEMLWSISGTNDKRRKEHLELLDVLINQSEHLESPKSVLLWG